MIAWGTRYEFICRGAPPLICSMRIELMSREPKNRIIYFVSNYRHILTFKHRPILVDRGYLFFIFLVISLFSLSFSLIQNNKSFVYLLFTRIYNEYSIWFIFLVCTCIVFERFFIPMILMIKISQFIKQVKRCWCQYCGDIYSWSVQITVQVISVLLKLCSLENLSWYLDIRVREY